MAFVEVTDACAVELRCTYITQRAELTLGFYTPGGYDLAALQDLTGKLATWWYTYLRPAQSSQVVMREIYARDLSYVAGPTWSDTTYAGTAGNLNYGVTLPGNVAWCVTFRSGLRGRAHRGRNYWFGFGTTQINVGNAIVASYRNTILAAYQRLLPGGGSDPTPHVWSVISRQFNGEVMGRHIPIIAVVAVDDTIDSMRKRLPGRGL